MVEILNGTIQKSIRQERWPKLLKSIVAFVDILGYTEMVKNSLKLNNANELLRMLHKSLLQSRKLIDPRYSDPILSFGKNDSFALRAFTDNIVIGHPVRDDGESELGSIFSHLSYFQMTLTMNGFFVRGAISLGDLYMDDIAVFGSALIEAYESEQKLARDPRIVLAPSAKQAVDRHLNYYADGRHAPQVRDLLKDSDGQYFLNYLDTIYPEEHHFYEEELKKHKEVVETKLKVHRNEPLKWGKYIWVAEYHNYYCNKCPTDCEHLKIDIDNFKASPSLIVD